MKKGIYRWIGMILISWMLCGCFREPIDLHTGTETPEAIEAAKPESETNYLVLKQKEESEDKTAEETETHGQDAIRETEDAETNRIYRKEIGESDQIKIVFAGDILFDSRYAVMSAMLQRGMGIEGGISSELLSIMRDADVCMVNNEFPYTNRGTPTPGKKFTFRADPRYASWLVDMGVDLVSLANNHAYDYGEISLTDTLDTLEAIHMPYVGAGRNLSEAMKPVTFLSEEKRICFISATQIERTTPPDTKEATETSPGVFRSYEIENLLKVIQEAKKDSDFVIVYVHWGTESTDQIDRYQSEQASQIASAGADLIIGDHPHVLQPVGFEDNVPVVYSMGNFLFNSKALDTCLVEATVGENGLESLQFIPARQEGCRVKKAEGDEKERILQYMRKISPEASIDSEGFITKP